MKINQILILVLLLSLSSCSIKHVDKGEEPEPENPDPEQPAESYFRATINDQYLQGPDDTGFSFMVETNMTDDEWTVQTDADWLSFNKQDASTLSIKSSVRSADNPDLLSERWGGAARSNGQHHDGNRQCCKRPYLPKRNGSFEDRPGV